MECVFCKIYENGDGVVIKKQDHFVIFDKFPASLGHMLVIPSKHYRNLLQTPQPTIDSMMATAKEIGKTFREKLDADGIKVVTNIERPAGQMIMHTHIHVIPRYLPHKHPNFEPHKEMTELERERMHKLIIKAIGD